MFEIRPLKIFRSRNSSLDPYSKLKTPERKSFQPAKQNLNLSRKNYFSCEYKNSESTSMISSSFMRKFSKYKLLQKHVKKTWTGLENSQTKETEKFYDNESILVSSLLSIPKPVTASVRAKQTRKINYSNSKFCQTKNHAKNLENSQNSSNRWIVSRFSIKSEDFDSPSPLIQSRYKN